MGCWEVIADIVMTEITPIGNTFLPGASSSSLCDAFFSFHYLSLSFCLKEIFNFSLSDMERNKQEAGMMIGCSEWDRQVAKLERGPVNTNTNTTNNVQQFFIFV